MTDKHWHKPLRLSRNVPTKRAGLRARKKETDSIYETMKV